MLVMLKVAVLWIDLVRWALLVDCLLILIASLFFFGLISLLTAFREPAPILYSLR
jgi:hypothetical protein